MDSVFKPFIVFGPSKSGTTWLQKCIDSHERVSCKFQVPIFPILDNEPLLFPIQNTRKSILSPSKGVYNANRTPFKGVFKNDEDEKIYKNQLKLISEISKSFWNHFAKSNKDSEGHEAERKLIQKIITGYSKEFLQKNTNKPILGTKAYTNFEKFFEIFPDSKVIVIFRDGRDVAVSKRYHHKRQGAYFNGDEKIGILRFINQFEIGRKVNKKLFMDRLGLVDESSFQIGSDHRLFSDASLEKIATDWKLVSEYLLEWMKFKKDNIVPVYYENMKINPIKELERAFRFIGVDVDDKQLENIISVNSFEALKKSKGDSFFRSGQSGKWKESFTEKDKKIFKEIAGELLIELDYEKDNNW